MAKEQSNSTTNPSSFIKGMIKDTDDSYFPQGSWYHARNAVNNSKDGNLGILGNEPSNTFCQQAPFPIIGAIHLNADRWVIYSTNNTLHEIGIFLEDQCTYTPLQTDQGQSMNQNNCLDFNQNNLIVGVAKENFDCTWSAYWANGRRNPDRIVNVDRPTFIQKCVTANNCITCTDTTALDCDRLRLSSLLITPCLTVSRGPNGGNLLNGSYYAVVAYVLNSQRVTDYFMPSDTQAIFEHDNVSGSLLVTVDQMDKVNFDFFELVIVRTVNSQTSAKKMGIYSTRQAQISIDYINEALPSIPVEQIPIRTPSYERSDAIFEIGDYMLRTGPTAKFDFNYQPLANRITTKWQAVAYPSNYYAQGGHNTGYFRDEVYSFFIRWVYNTGDKSSSYHIPGRPAAFLNNPPDPLHSELGGFYPSPQLNDGSTNALETVDPIAPFQTKKWMSQNTGYETTKFAPPVIQPDGGILIAEGNMGYWESTELYPDKKPLIFNASGLKNFSNPTSNWAAITVPPYAGTTVLQYDICGQPIRHHKFPDNKTVPHYRNKPGVTISQATNGVLTPTDKQIEIVVLGVAFDNILPPVDNDGVLIPGIIGYEVLRGSREGNKTVIAKGMINNMRSYPLDDGSVGLYQNYPYNYLGADESLAEAENEGEHIAFNPASFKDNGPLASNNLGPGGSASPVYSKNQFTFHSPDTSFNNPFLSSKELRIYGEMYGVVNGNFDESPEHPKEKLITDVAFMVAAMIGVGAAAVAMKGKRKQRYSQPVVDKNATHGVQANPGPGLWGINDALVGNAALAAVQAASELAYTTATASYKQGVPIPPSENSILNLFGLIVTGEDIALSTYRASLKSIGLTPNVTPPQKIDDIEESDYGAMPKGLQILGGVPIFSHYWTLGTDAAMELITSVVPYTQYAMRYTSHGFSNLFNPTTSSVFRYQMTNAIYINDGFQDFGENSNAKINNVNRGKGVAIQTLIDVPDPTTLVDNTAQTIGSSLSLRQLSTEYKGGNKRGFDPRNAVLPFQTATVSHYAAMKQRMRNQYGQLDGIIQIPATYCDIEINPPIAGAQVTQVGTTSTGSGIIFNGDTYIGRFTEKNTFFYFWDWLYDQPDGFEFNYQQRYMLNFPRYWADFTKFDAGGFLTDFFGSLLSLNFSGLIKAYPSSRHSLDGQDFPGAPLAFFSAILRITERYFYLFQSGVRDFYVESEINIDLRDWNEPAQERFYDPRRGYTDLKALFDPGIIRSGNFFKYDQSLSVSRVFNNFFGWGNVQDRDYDPETAETCFTYYSTRVIYSLPLGEEVKKDFWRVFLANNYKDFNSTVSAVEPINKNGAMFFFYQEAPIMYQGVDTLETELGTKVTLGDGGLFSQPKQNLVNANESYEYGSCQNRLSVMNTPVGLYWMSQNQGKIFKYAGGLSELSNINMKFWFSRYLPYQLTKDFPNFDLIDNPVVGIGCSTIFNNRDSILYFAKKDYKLRTQYVGQVIYTPGTGFTLGTLVIILGDPQYFENASWTISFDPKNTTWQSFHDWHPDLMLPSKTHHLTTNKQANGTGGIWKHTDNQTSFCNFYGVDYPWEFDYVAQTGTTVNTLRSIEYFMEAHIYNNDSEDFYHVLDYNFDHAIIYNSEQVSGVLILNDTPKNDVAGRLLYPIINPTSIDILYDKVEQKYRFNQFWDITADRGEFTYPNVQRPIWETKSNGYIRSLNPANLNYNKLEFQRKKFRHFANHVVMYKNVSNNIKMLMKLSLNKNLISKR